MCPTIYDLPCDEGWHPREFHVLTQTCWKVAVVHTLGDYVDVVMELLALK